MTLDRGKAAKILSLWANKESEWLTYKEIIDGVRDLDISERTAARYLSALVRERKLSKRELGYKKTSYRPFYRFLEQLRLSRDFFVIHEKSLGKLGKEIMDRIEKTILNSEEVSQRIESLICKEIDKMSAESRHEEAIDKAIYEVLSREKLSKSDSQEMVLLTKRFLVDNFLYPLSSMLPAGTIETYNLVSMICEDIERMLTSYMDLWAFLYTHPGASLEFGKYVRTKCEGIFKG